ncbi:hypothetical protein Tco_0780128 [Tanacetum coccineum]
MLPQLNKDELIKVEHLKLSDMKIVKKNSVVVLFGLVQLSIGNPQDDTWELLEDLYKKFRVFDSWGKDFKEGGLL